jgi:hypothetical protein
MSRVLPSLRLESHFTKITRDRRFSAIKYTSVVMPAEGFDPDIGQRF